MIGIDIEEVKRFVMPRAHSFIIKSFTKNEIAYAYARTIPAMHLAGFFCAKEAYCKSIGRGFAFQKIEIVHKSSGEPYLRINGRLVKFVVSISHTKTTAAAIVLKK